MFLINGMRQECEYIPFSNNEARIGKTESSLLTKCLLVE